MFWLGSSTAGLYAEANELELDKTGGYLLSFNGAKVVDYKTKKSYIKKCTMLKRHIGVYERAKQYNLAVMTYTDELILTKMTDSMFNIEGDINHMPIKHIDNFKDAVNFL
ncbi:MAG: hypothetical protein ACLRWM_11055 [Streptococcus sp.]